MYPQQMYTDGVNVDDEFDRFDWYYQNRCTVEAKTDSYGPTRMLAYERLGWDDAALKDVDWHVRIKAYNIFGWTENAKVDNEELIRLTAYRRLGWDATALTDVAESIRNEARYNLNKIKEPV